MSNSSDYDIYCYEGSEQDKPEVAPYTGVNVRNTFKSDHVVMWKFVYALAVVLHTVSDARRVASERMIS